MPHPSKVKGNGFERELVNSAKESGMQAERAYASNGKALGEAETVDLVVSGKRIQAKRRKKLADYLQIPDGCDAVVFRQDRGEPMVLIDWWEYLDLVKRRIDSAGRDVTDLPGLWDETDRVEKKWTLMCDEARGRPRCMVVCSRGNQIADINPYRDTWESDARLIAKAPETLEKLKRLSAIVLSQSDSMSDETLDIAAEAQELIKEIEG